MVISHFCFMTLWLCHWWPGWYFTLTCYGFSCDVWCVLISVSPGMCISSLRNTSPSPSLVCSLIWSIFDLPAWLMSSPGCKVIPRLTVSHNFTHFFHLKQLEYMKMYNTYLVLTNNVSSTAFLCRCVWILTPTPKLPDRSHWAISALQRRWRLGHAGKSGDDARWA